jgi:hypothetical protein
MIRHLSSERGFPPSIAVQTPSIAVQTAISEFANSVGYQTESGRMGH